eukprot:2171799-Alexandrium_andersonii.AAC.1
MGPRGPTRRAAQGGGQTALGWFLVDAAVAGSMEADASWRRDLSDHACLIVRAVEGTRRRGDCPPRRLRQLPPEAWADLRT